MEYLIILSIFAIFLFRLLFVLNSLDKAIVVSSEYFNYILISRNKELLDDYSLEDQIMGFDEYFWNFFYWGLPIIKEKRSFLINKEYL